MRSPAAWSKARIMQASSATGRGGMNYHWGMVMWMDGWEIWGFGLLLLVHLFWGGELEDFHISYLKVDIFMDELFTWIQVSIGDEHRWTIFIGFIGMIFTSHHITTSGNGTHFSGIIYSHSSWPGAKAAKCTVKTAISVGMAGNHHENSCPVAGPRTSRTKARWSRLPGVRENMDDRPEMCGSKNSEGASFSIVSCVCLLEFEVPPFLGQTHAWKHPQ